jgi:hypothetical protein
VGQLMPWLFLPPAEFQSPPSMLLTRPTLSIPPAPNLDTKPSVSRRPTLPEVLPIPVEQLSAHTRQLVDTLYEGLEIKSDDADKQVAPGPEEKEVVEPPRGRALVTMPSVSDFILSRPITVSPSPSRGLVLVRDSRPMNQPTSKVKLTGGFYLRSGRLVIPPNFYVLTRSENSDIVQVYQNDRRILKVELSVELELTDLPFIVSDSTWKVPTGDYNFPRTDFLISVLPSQSYRVHSFVPSDMWMDAESSFLS